MIDLLKKSAAYAFAIISVVFTFVPEAIFGKVILISEDVLEQFTLEGYTLEINIIVNRVLIFVSVWFIAAFIYKAYLLLRNKVSIKGNNYKITVEYGDLQLNIVHILKLVLYQQEQYQHELKNIHQN